MKRHIITLVLGLAAISCATRTQEVVTTIPIVDQVLTTPGEVSKYKSQLFKQWKDSIRTATQAEYDAQALDMDDYTMKLWWKVYGEKPAGGRSLYISLHGGGKAEPEVNDQQWENQKKLYEPAEGVYLAPRAIVNTWDLHFVPQADVFYERIIEMMVAFEDVNPNKVYLLGYSAGGDAVWRLAPRMADHWAAASMMAGHPGDVVLEGLRNTPFMIWCGANDDAYDRNKECEKRIQEMDALQASDPAGYVHEGHIVPDKGHWMDREDAAAIEWMSKYTRNPYPKKVVWVQGDVMKESFYWLGIPLTEAAKGSKVVATVDRDTNTVDVEWCDYTRLTVYMNDDILDLDKPVHILFGGRELFSGMVERNANNIRRNLLAREDPAYAFPAQVTVTL
jgi:poly(3-hydroxybutyrate) depolymerase